MVRPALYTLLHDARPVLLNLAEPAGSEITPWGDRVRYVEATHEGVWELPVLGEVTAPERRLIRPDGHVAWVGESDRPDTLRGALDLVRSTRHVTELGDRGVISSSAAAAIRLQLETVAEGIESNAELDQLRDQHCELGQGYLFARPLPASEAESLLESIVAQS